MTRKKQPVARGPRTTLVPITIPMTFSGIAELTGIPAQSIAKRYHAAKANNPRKQVTLQTLCADYTPKPRRIKG